MYENSGEIFISWNISKKFKAKMKLGVAQLWLPLKTPEALKRYLRRKSQR